MEQFSYYLEHIGEIGIVRKINYPIVTVEGLPHVKPSELVLFEKGQVGEVFSIDKENVEILLFSKHLVKIQSKAVRTDTFLTVPVGVHLLGTITDPLGNIILGKKSASGISDSRRVDVSPLGIHARTQITRPFLTGVAIVDLMIPLGKGQKELVIGDRKTGKTSFIWSALKHHVQTGGIVIYGAIGRRESDIKKLKEFLEENKLTPQVAIVASVPQDPPSLIYLTPFTSMMYAEYFKDKGNEVLLILDDMTTHARFYREIALLGKRFPGRDSYPGDIFYTHARLLERAGNFISGKDEASITCLLSAETVEGDLTSYIGTNLMGMTDGHIFFDSNIYYRGRRPAVNVALSVTRVGRQTQSKVKRDINRELTAFIALYEKMQNLSQFGSELSETVKHILQTGERIFNFFNQSYTVIIPEEVQLVLFCLLWLNCLEESSVDKIAGYRDNLIHAFQSDDRVKKLLRELLNASSFNSLLGTIAKRRDEVVPLCMINKG